MGYIKLHKNEVCKFARYIFWKYAFIHLLLLEYMKWLNIKDIKDLVLRIVYTVKILLTAMTAQENYAACINI